MPRHRFSVDNAQSWKAGLLPFQAREMRFVLPLDVLEVRKEAFRILRGLPGMAWAAFVHKADASRNELMFAIHRWDNRVGLLVRRMSGCAFSAMAFAELWPVLDGISAAAQARLATVPTGERANTRH